MADTLMKVLLIEDNPGDALLIQELLAENREASIDLKWAEGLSTGVECLEGEAFDLVLLDLSLPESQGLDALSTVQIACPQIAIIVLSGIEEERAAFEALNRGAQDYLVKGRTDGYLIGRSISYAIERKKVEEKLAWEAIMSAAVAELSSALITEGSIDRVSHLILEFGKHLTGSTLGYVGYVDPETGYLVCPAITRKGWDACRVEKQRTVFGRAGGLWGWVLDHQESVLTNRAGEDPRFSEIPAGHIPIRRFLSAPAIIGETVVGQVALANADRDYTDDDLTVAERLAALYAIAIQRKQAEEALVASEEQYTALLHTALDGFWTTDFRGHLRDVNDAYCRLTGYSREELLEMSVEDIDVVETPAETARHIQKIMEMGGDLFEGRHRCKDGHIVDVEVSVNYSTERERLFWFVRNITERKWAEKELVEGKEELVEINRQLQENQAQLVQSEKMASIGQLAAGVAHEINNPVGFINSNLTTLDEYRKDLTELVTRYLVLEDMVGREMAGAGPRQQGCISGQEPPEGAGLATTLAAIGQLKDKMDLDYVLEDFGKIISESREGTERVKRIVQDLKDFSHIDQAELAYSDLNKGLDSTLNIVWNEIKYKAVVFKDYGDIPEVYCYPQQINQVFMNILVNAAQAIEEKGEIRISTNYVGDDAPRVEIRISDTGKGIAPENLSKIFNPFFTTKPVGKGTGLGLSTAYKIVANHGGELKVESEVGKGTTFIVRLPVNGPG